MCNMWIIVPSVHSVYSSTLVLLQEKQLEVPRWHSASQSFVVSGVPTWGTCKTSDVQFQVWIGLVWWVWEQHHLPSSKTSCFQYSSSLRKHWRDCINKTFLNWMLCLCFLSSFLFPVNLFESGTIKTSMVSWQDVKSLIHTIYKCVFESENLLSNQL